MENKKLTEREIEFLRLCCTDCTYKEIAELMHLGVRTIDNYRDKLCQKLGARSRIGLMLYAIKSGIAEFGDRENI